MLALDMNIIVTSQSKVLYSSEEFMKVLGTTADGPKNFAHMFDVVIELKKDTAGTEAVIQLKRYVEAIRRDFGEARGILVAPGISKKAYAALTGLGLEYVRLSVDKCLKVLEKYRKEGLTAFM